MIDQTGNCLDKYATAAAAGRPAASAVIGIRVALINLRGPVSAVGVYVDAGINHDAIALQVDGTAGTAGAALGRFVAIA